MRRAAIGLGLIQLAAAIALLASGYTSFGLTLGFLGGAIVASTVRDRPGYNDRNLRSSAIGSALVGVFFATFSTLQVTHTIDGNTLSTVMCYGASVLFIYSGWRLHQLR